MDATTLSQYDLLETKDKYILSLQGPVLEVSKADQKINIINYNVADEALAAYKIYTEL